jgi:glycerol uptake facilitator-like aquaporin
MKRYLAELVGTFLLTFAVSISLASKFPVPTPIVAALTLGVCVYVFGGISGTHINPAITIGILTVGRISLRDAGAYILAQFAGAGLAMAVTATIVTPAAVTASDSTRVLTGELFGAFCLAAGVASVVFGKAPAPAAGLTIGGSLLLGISIASSVSNGILNPAVAVGIRSISLAYLIAPIIGSLVAFQLYQFLAVEKEVPRPLPEQKAQTRSAASGVN